MNLEYMQGLELCVEATKQKDDDRLFSMWVSLYPNMDKKSFVSFQDFKKKSTEPATKKQVKTKEELIADAERIIRITKLKRGE